MTDTRSAKSPSRAKQWLQLLSPRQHIVAYLALFISLGGTSYAATNLPANSVGASQLRSGSVTASKVRSHSLGPAAIKPHSLAASSIAPHSLSANLLAAGVIPASETLKTVVVPGDYGPPSCPAAGCSPAAPGTTESYNANCPTGTQVLSGGYIEEAPGEEVVSASVPIAAGRGDPVAGSGGGWEVTFSVTASSAQIGDSGAGSVYAICASLS
jgi:hypothetical protein